MRKAVFLILTLMFIAGCKSAPEQAGKGPEKETPAAVEPETGEAEPAVESGEGAKVYHVVKKGETLYGIGKMYGMAWEEIAKANNIGDVKSLKVGTKLLIPGAKK
jgi:2',3'-cyclic-nucleotide 2'-phosphodiesterase/3'-nucleotidase